MNSVPLTLTPEQMAWLAAHGPRVVSILGVFSAELRVVSGQAELAITLDEEWVGRISTSVGGWIDGWMREA